MQLLVIGDAQVIAVNRQAELQCLAFRLHAHTQRRNNQHAAWNLIGPCKLHKRLAQSCIGPQTSASLLQGPSRQDLLERKEHSRRRLMVHSAASPFMTLTR